MRTVDQAVLDRLIFFLLDSPLRGRVYGKLESVKQQKMCQQRQQQKNLQQRNLQQRQQLLKKQQKNKLIQI